TRLVLLANGGTKETKVRWLANHQPDRFARHFGLRALFHAERDNAKISEWPGRAGNRQPGCFDADIIRSRCAAANAHARALLGAAIIGRAPRNGEVEVQVAFEHLWRVAFREPRLQHFHQALAQRFGFQHTTIEKDVGGPDWLFVIAMCRQELREMPRDGGVHFIWQSDLA